MNSPTPVIATHTVFQQALERTAQTLDIAQDELLLWLDQQATPMYTQLQLLRVAHKYALDPLSDELAILNHDLLNPTVYITINGWSKLINQHPHFAGMSLRESTEQLDNIPNWMECTIYRDDRILPIVIKEYFEEVKTSHPSWQQMPRRMLRHRVIQQCARLALGISSSETKSEIGAPIDLDTNVGTQATSQSERLKETLKAQKIHLRKLGQ